MPKSRRKLTREKVLQFVGMVEEAYQLSDSMDAIELAAAAIAAKKLAEHFEFEGEGLSRSVDARLEAQLGLNEEC